MRVICVDRYSQMVEVVHWVLRGATVGAGLSVTGHKVVVIGIRVVVSTVLLAGHFLTFGEHLTTA